MFHSTFSRAGPLPSCGVWDALLLSGVVFFPVSVLSLSISYRVRVSQDPSFQTWLSATKASSRVRCSWLNTVNDKTVQGKGWVWGRELITVWTDASANCQHAWMPTIYNRSFSLSPVCKPRTDCQGNPRRAAAHHFFSHSYWHILNVFTFNKNVAKIYLCALGPQILFVYFVSLTPYPILYNVPV